MRVKVRVVTYVFHLAVAIFKNQTELRIKVRVKNRVVAYVFHSAGYFNKSERIKSQV